MSQRLGDLLVKEKVITPEQLSQASKVQKETNCRLGSALVKLGFLSDEDVTNFLSRQYGVPAINLSYFEIDPAVVKLIPFETAKRYQILPLSRVGASLTIAMVDPTNVRSEEHTSELQSHVNLVCRLLLEKKKNKNKKTTSSLRPVEYNYILEISYTTES